MISATFNWMKSLLTSWFHTESGTLQSMRDVRALLIPGADPNLQDEPIPIRGDELVIGRHTDCQFRPDDPFLSLQHCRIHIEEGGCFIEDMGSTNGTFVNFEPVTNRQQLFEGDILEVGMMSFYLTLVNAA